MVRRRAQRAVSNHVSKFELAAILRDALAALGLLRMRSEGRKDSQHLRMTVRSWSLSPAELTPLRKNLVVIRLRHVGDLPPMLVEVLQRERADAGLLLHRPDLPDA